MPELQPAVTIAERIDAAIAQAGQLATLPEVAQQVMQLAEQPSATGEELARVLSRDPALSARVLKVVNSAYYGQRREVSTISAAVVVLGFAAIKNIAVAASLARMFRIGPLPGGFDPRQLWVHATAVATAARELATRVRGTDAAEAFLAGLLHDIGIIVALQGCRPEFLALLEATAREPERPFRDLELEQIGITHEEFGEALSRAWRFPDSLQRVTAWHHRPMELAAAERHLSAIIYVADHVAAMAHLGSPCNVSHEPVDPAVLAWLGLELDVLDQIVATLPTLVYEIAPVFSGGT
jgi:HD-like signal output (HDOD) protein